MQKIHQMIVNKLKFCLLVFFIFFTISISFSQNLEEIKRNDTIYVYFNVNIKNTIKKKSINTGESVFFKNYITYEFNSNFINTIIFISNTYKNRDNIKKGIKNDEFLAKKSFLKKHKEVVLDYDFFERNGFKETFFAIHLKTVYLIDEEEIKGRKIKVKQVDVACYTCLTE